MNAIALINQKGGAGKTTLTLCLSVEAWIRGQSVVVIDLDSQSLADDWGRQREATEPVVVPASIRRLAPLLEASEESGVELVFVDTSPTNNADALAVAKASDLIVIPCRATGLDIRATHGTLENLLLLSPEDCPPIWVVLNSVVAGSPDHRAAVASLEEMGLQVAPCVLGHRNAFHRSYEAGLTPQEIDPKSKASKEIQELFTFVRQQLEHREPNS